LVLAPTAIVSQRNSQKNINKNPGFAKKYEHEGLALSTFSLMYGFIFILFGYFKFISIKPDMILKK